MPYKDLLNHKLLSPSEERQLIQEAQSGNRMSRDRIVLSYMRLCYKVAGFYAYFDKDVSTEDLVGDAVEGLMHAIDKFDVEMERRFTGYAAKAIRWKIERSDQLQGIIHLPAGVFREQQQFKSAKRVLAAWGNHEPTFEELSEVSGLALARVAFHARLNETVCNVVSLDEPVSVNEDNTPRSLVDFLESPVPEIERTETALDLEWFLSHLSEADRFIITRSYGISGKLTLEDIGEQLNRSRYWVLTRRNEVLSALQRLNSALEGSVSQVSKVIKNPQDVMNLPPTRVFEGVRFIDGVPVKSEGF